MSGNMSLQQKSMWAGLPSDEMSDMSIVSASQIQAGTGTDGSQMIRQKDLMLQLQKEKDEIRRQMEQNERVM